MNIRTPTLAALLLAGLTTDASSQTLEEIIAKNSAARGIDKLEKITGVKMSGKLTAVGTEMEITLFHKSPSSARVEGSFMGQTFITAYDEHSAWQINPMMGSAEPAKMSEEEARDAREQTDFGGPLVRYREKGSTVALAGSEDLEGTKVHKLKITEKNGTIRYLYLDARSGLDLKQTVIQKRYGSEIEYDVYYRDYRQVEGIMFPFTVENRVQGGSSTMVFKSIEVNPRIDDALFRMPEGAQKQAPSDGVGFAPAPDTE